MAMDRAVLVSVDEYLNTSFVDGDREYVDGRIVERNVGEIDHSDLQGAIVTYLRTRFPAFWTGPEVRVQVKPTHFRVPDICVVQGGKPEGRIVVQPPFLVIEILSRDDRADDVQERIEDYLEFGVPCVWVINPRSRRGYVHTSESIHEVRDGVFRTPGSEIELPLGANALSL